MAGAFSFSQMPGTIYWDLEGALRCYKGADRERGRPRYTAPPPSSAHAAVTLLSTGLEGSADDAVFKLGMLDEGAPLDGRLEADPARNGWCALFP